MLKLSVIIPVHNTEKYLPSCLNSVLNQTLDDMEVICVHDHSTDRSLEILKYFEKRYPYKMKVIDMQDEYGVSCARNLGMRYAQGKYIGFVDSDDIIALDRYQNFYETILEYQAPVVVGNFFELGEEDFLNQEFIFSIETRKPRILNYLKDEKLIFFESPACWDKMFSHDFLEKSKLHFLENKIYEDVGFSYPLLLLAKESVEIVREDYGYRKRSGSIMNLSNLVSTRFLDILDVCNYAKKFGKENFLDSKQMTLLDDVLKRELYVRIMSLQYWNISEEDKKFLFQKMLSICEFYFPNFLTMETSFGAFMNEYFCTYATSNYQIETYKNEQIVSYQTECLLRKIRNIAKS